MKPPQFALGGKSLWAPKDALFTETELAKNYTSPQALRVHPEMARFINWVEDKPAEFNPPARRSRSKGQF